MGELPEIEILEMHNRTAGVHLLPDREAVER